MLAMIIILYYYLGGCTRYLFRFFTTLRLYELAVTQSKKFNMPGSHTLSVE